MNLMYQSASDFNFFILQYPLNCGKSCHENLISQSKEMNVVYEIINSDHALVRIELSQLQLLVNDLSNQIIDYIPLLPQLKIDEDLLLDIVCFNQSDLLQLHMIFMPLASNDLLDLQTLITFHPELFPTEHSFTATFDDLSASHRSVQTILIPLKCQYGEIGLSLFSSLSSIQWIELRPTMRSSTYWANGITQSGEPLVNILMEANLTGTDEVIGIADTGIDMNSCFFSDPSVKMIYNKINKNHRKVIYYDAYANTVDDDGHGTLVASTSAGKCDDPSNGKSDFNGIAPNSKIAFVDIGAADGTLKLPSDLYSNLFLKLYNAGAKIQSMSWGSPSNKYTSDARYEVFFSPLALFWLGTLISSCGIILIH
jgi:hypothetical protein